MNCDIDITLGTFKSALNIPTLCHLKVHKRENNVLFTTFTAVFLLNWSSLFQQTCVTNHVLTKDDVFYHKCNEKVNIYNGYKI